MEKEAFSRVVLHIASAAKKGLKQFLVLLNLVYFHVFKTMNVNRTCVKFGIHECQRHIPVYQLAEILGTEKS